jgi:hypothetical protein
MTQDISGLITLGITGITVWSGTLWFLWSRIQVTKDALAAFELAVAKEYVQNRNLKELEDRITTAIDRLVDRLDRRLEGH